jgi:hypothetical protein
MQRYLGASPLRRPLPTLDRDDPAQHDSDYRAGVTAVAILATVAAVVVLAAFQGGIF